MTDSITAATTLADMTLAELHAAASQNAALAKDHAGIAKQYEGEIARRLLPQIRSAFEADEKQHGTVRFPAGEGFAAKVEVSRRVKWDSGKLLALAAEMPWAEANHLFRFSAEMSEAMYGSLMPDGNLKGRIDAARTVEYGAPKVTLERKEA